MTFWDRLLRAFALATLEEDASAQLVPSPLRETGDERFARLARAARAYDEDRAIKTITEHYATRSPMQGNVGTDIFSGLNYYSAHNIPALSHRIVVCSGDGTTVFFQQHADAERYAQRLIRRGQEDEVAIFELTPCKVLKTSAPRVEIETLSAPGKQAALSGETPAQES